jgi:conjugal transfer pilus assembly protein TraW
MGQTFPIAEESFLEFLQKQLAGKDLSQKLAQIKTTLFEKAQNPAPVEGLHLAKKSRLSLLDLSFKTKKDIRDTTGKIIAKAGTTVNPLERINLSSGLLFLDGTKENHLIWAREQAGNFKWILVKGKPFEVEEREKRPVYFDQRGAHAARFQIENIPAKVVQRGKYLLVQELALQGDS